MGSTSRAAAGDFSECEQRLTPAPIVVAKGNQVAHALFIHVGERHRRTGLVVLLHHSMIRIAQPGRGS